MKKFSMILLACTCLASVHAQHEVVISFGTTFSSMKGDDYGSASVTIMNLFNLLILVTPMTGPTMARTAEVSELPSRLSMPITSRHIGSLISESIQPHKM